MGWNNPYPLVSAQYVLLQAYGTNILKQSLTQVMIKLDGA